MLTKSGYNYSLSEYGILIQQRITEMAGIYENIKILNYVIMPNHVHLLIIVKAKTNEIFIAQSNDILRRGSSGTSRTPSPTTLQNAIIPSYMSSFKRFTNKDIGFPIWQRSYHDHIVRNKKELNYINQYIDSNPKQWNVDCYNEKTGG